MITFYIIYGIIVHIQGMKRPDGHPDRIGPVEGRKESQVDQTGQFCHDPAPDLCYIFYVRHSRNSMESGTADIGACISGDASSACGGNGESFRVRQA